MTPLEIGELKEAKPVAGMKPWACSYEGDDGLRYGITLFGTDREQVEQMGRENLPQFEVDGLLTHIADVEDI